MFIVTIFVFCEKLRYSGDDVIDVVTNSDGVHTWRLDGKAL